jgi:SAM-dependent MidA family methyltransferase
VAEYMEACLAHPEFGYYMGRDPFGRAGDFITAPEISQMFGEMIGLWAAVVWRSMGEPAEVILAELGPGRGTLMKDFLRAAGTIPAFRRALKIHLVEISSALMARQQETLEGEQVTWLNDMRALPAGPMLVVANEFFDALPISQFVRRNDGWHERHIGLSADSELTFVDGPLADIRAPASRSGDIFEISGPGRDCATWLGSRLSEQNGAALVIDYGHAESAVGDTLQAVKGHRPVPVLADPGSADLTAHVDFQALAEAAAPAHATETTTQGSFLRSLGIELRAERLASHTPQKAEVLLRACRRLIDPSGMGTLFKVRALTHPGLPTPPGFLR